MCDFWAISKFIVWSSFWRFNKLFGLESQASVNREELWILLEYQVLYVSFYSSAFIARFSLHIEYEVQVSVNVVFFVYVILEGFVPCFKSESIYSTDKAFISHILFYEVSLISHVCKGIDNDTKDEIQKQNDNHNEEGNVKHPSWPILLLILVQLLEHISNTSTRSESIIESGGKT